MCKLLISFQIYRFAQDIGELVDKVTHNPWRK